MITVNQHSPWASRAPRVIEKGPGGSDIYARHYPDSDYPYTRRVNIYVQLLCETRDRMKREFDAGCSHFSCVLHTDVVLALVIL